MKGIALTALLGITCLGIYEISKLGVRIHRGRQIAAASRPYERRNPGAAHRILVVGDSTRLGTGAVRPEESVAGRIAAEFPAIEIINLARNGAKSADALFQMESVGLERFDIVLVQVGGNDILGFTDLGKMRDTIRQILHQAKENAANVLFISTGNAGLAPAFFPPISWLYTARTRKVRTLLMEVSRDLGVQYVDLFREKGNELFRGDPDRYYTSDYLHPSSEGYRIWYEELKRQTSLVEILGKGRDRTGTE